MTPVGIVVAAAKKIMADESDTRPLFSRNSHCRIFCRIDSDTRVNQQATKRIPGRDVTRSTKIMPRVPGEAVPADACGQQPWPAAPSEKRAAHTMGERGLASERAVLRVIPGGHARDLPCARAVGAGLKQPVWRSTGSR